MPWNARFLIAETYFRLQVAKGIKKSFFFKHTFHKMQVVTCLLTSPHTSTRASDAVFTNWQKSRWKIQLPLLKANPTYACIFILRSKGKRKRNCMPHDLFLPANHHHICHHKPHTHTRILLKIPIMFAGKRTTFHVLGTEGQSKCFCTARLPVLAVCIYFYPCGNACSSRCLPAWSLWALKKKKKIKNTENLVWVFIQ